MDTLFLSPSLHVYTVTNICTNTFQMNHISDMKNQSFPLRKKESKSYILRETRKHTHTQASVGITGHVDPRVLLYETVHALPVLAYKLVLTVRYGKHMQKCFSKLENTMEMLYKAITIAFLVMPRAFHSLCEF